MKPPEEVKREIVCQWLQKAEEDFHLAEHLAGENIPYLNAIGSHAQQAAEKFLKAFLVQHQIEFPKTHDLDKLLDLIVSADNKLADSLRCSTDLTPYGADIRYPGDLPELTKGDAIRAVDLARKVRAAVFEKIGVDTDEK